MRSYKRRRDHFGRGHSQGHPRRCSIGWTRQTPLGHLSIPTTTAGYKKLLEWAKEFGPLEHAGVEGTGCFGAGLVRFLKAQEVKVSEVIRPKRRDQYRSGKGRIPSMPRQQHARYLRVQRPVSQKTPTARWR